MDEHGGDADFLEGLGEVGRGPVLVVPAEPHFGGDGNSDGFDHGADELLGAAEFGHHGGTATDPADLADGTSHVDVDGDGAEILADPGGVPHLGRDGAEQLDGEGAVERVGFDQFEGLGIALEEGAGIDEIGGAKTDATEFADDDAKGEVGVAGEGRQEEIGREFEGAEADHVGGSKWRDDMGGERTGPTGVV